VPHPEVSENSVGGDNEKEDHLANIAAQGYQSFSGRLKQEALEDPNSQGFYRVVIACYKSIP
jgi:hypothetical protein